MGGRGDLGREERRRAGLTAVRSVVDALWPGSEMTTGPATAEPTEGRATRTMVAIPSLSRPLYLLPAARAAAVAVRPAYLGPRYWRVWGVWALQRSAVLGRVRGSRVQVVVDESGSDVEDLLAEVLGEAPLLAVRVGRPRLHRTLVLWALSGSGAPLAVAKIGTGVVAREGLAREHAALVADPAGDVPGLRAPAALGLVRWREADVLVMSPLVPGRPRRTPFVPVAQMQALAARGPGSGVVQPLRETPAVATYRARAATLQPELATWLQDAWTRLVDEHGDVEVPTGAWHGDWVSWNMARAADGEVLLWDWEHHAAEALAGWDHVHFLAQELRRVGTGTAQEERWLEQARAALTGSWGLSAAQAEAVTLAYLLAVNTRYLEDREDAEVLVPRAGWGRPMVERVVPTRGPRRAQAEGE